MKKETNIIILNEKDNVAIAKNDFDNKRQGDRFALIDIDKDSYLYQYGFPFAKSLGIKEGENISLENTTNEIPQSSGSTFMEPPKTTYLKKYQERTFLGYKRSNGKVGTRNFITIIPTSMCASEVANQVAATFNTKEFEKQFPNINGVVSLAHTEGCGCGAGMQINRTMQVLKGFALHENVGGVVFIDLGCEQTSYDVMNPYLYSEKKDYNKPIQWITIQENGGIGPTLEKSISLVKEMAKEVNEKKREPVPISHLTLGTQCGASDRFSGITANPLIGSVADKIIQGQGKAILSEVPEMLGVFDMFYKRFASQEVAKKFQNVVSWYMNIANKLDVNISNNVVPANVKGGLINSYIKSLGAVMKGGSTNIEDIIEYAQPISKNGLSIMQGPGNDLESLTGIVASGANIICFSTGYGTITGNAITPVVKVSSNTSMYKRLSENMDFNAGRILENESIETLSEELLEQVIKIASGKKTWSEKWKQKQFQIWTAGKLTL